MTSSSDEGEEDLEKFDSSNRKDDNSTAQEIITQQASILLGSLVWLMTYSYIKQQILQNSCISLTCELPHVF